MIAFPMMAAAVFAQPALQPFSSLIGHCYAGTAPGGQGVDRHCFESVYGGEHIRDRHVVTVGGKSVYEGETLYSVKQSQIVFTYWNSLGGVGTGTAVLAPDQWHFSGTIHATPTGSEQPMATAWKITPDGYEVNSGGKLASFKRAD